MTSAMRLAYELHDLVWPLETVGEPVSLDANDERERFTYDEDGLRLVIEVDPAIAKIVVALHPSLDLLPILRITLHDCAWIHGTEDTITFAWSRLSETPGPDASHAALRIRLRPLDVDLLTSPPDRGRL